MLERAFAGAAVMVRSSTRDGQLNLVEVWGDRNPGDFYLFNALTRKADLVFSRAEWLDPAKMASTRAIALDARDGIHRSEEHTSELQSLMRISYAVFCLKKKKETIKHNHSDTL